MDGKYIFTTLMLFLVPTSAFTDDAKVYTSANEFFQENRVTSEKPVILFIMGLSGSGKSHWGRLSTNFGWQAIDVDKNTEHEIIGLSKKGEVAPEIGTVPDVTNSSHFYALRQRGHDLSFAQANQYINDRKSFVWDAVGFGKLHKLIADKMTGSGYQTWWLIFKPETWERNRLNLFLRESQGGLASFKSNPLEKRCRRLSKMLQEQKKAIEDGVNNPMKYGLAAPDQMFWAVVPDLRDRLPSGDPCSTTVR